MGIFKTLLKVGTLGALGGSITDIAKDAAKDAVKKKAAREAENLIDKKILGNGSKKKSRSYNDPDPNDKYWYLKDED